MSPSSESRPAGSPRPSPESAQLAQLHRRILACRRCQTEGLLERAIPVVAAPIAARVVLVGQAPGRIEQTVRRPFSGRGGRILMRWLGEAGLGDEEEVRRAVYLTSITKCFPGAAESGTGDRKPSRAEVELCRDHLERQLGLLRPWLVLAVGQMAVERFLGPRPMQRTVGRLFSAGGEELDPDQLPDPGPLPLVLPLPHPSGASRWLNQESNRALLGRALELLHQLLSAPPRVSAPPGAPPILGS